MGDFTGFSFGKWHSTDPNTGVIVYRVSGGDRYDEQLHPEIKDRTAEVSGVNGNYYFGSDFGPRTIDIEIAFDHLTETQFRDLRRVFGIKEIKELIFDEHPYKKYMAKIANPIELSYVCFDEPAYTWETIPDGYNTNMKGIGKRDFEHKVYTGVTERIYKGEGKISFICYFPFAKSCYKVLDRPELKNSDWAFSSGILEDTIYTKFDKYNSSSGIIKIYNGGDLATGFRLYCPFSAATASITLQYRPYSGGPVSTLQISGLKRLKYDNSNDDKGFLINSDNFLIQGVQVAPHLVNDNREYTTSKNIYNKYIQAGTFFRLEPNTRATQDSDDGAQIVISNMSGINVSGIEIFYDYLYF